MIIQPIQPNSPAFGYNHPLKTLYLKGKLPIKYGFYGGRLNAKNVSLEHLKPHSQGGKTELDNLVLSTKNNNQNRGSEPLKDYITIKNVTRYLQQFIGLKIGNFNGNEYIQKILQTLEGLI